ncbi:tetratricopeptide repeat protein [Streptomyces sp. NRRL F-5126]|uniref:tetratricopeptide repeat protein n=1 Tax=Streptomyces sp. NRRL F-5126 TaxID=1463857 RepID=UPI001F38FA10|nr:tetratricopeptide repeat protein [Streptomyces sp. NRRL F-5126]
MIRERAQAQFAGRREQVTQFAENLHTDPESQAQFLFHVRGVGGVGKSTLLRHWQELARAASAVTAVVDEGDVHDVPQALSELARQMAGQTGSFKEFDRAAEQYRRELEAANPVALAGETGAYGGEASTSSRVVAQAALGAASLIPVAGGVVSAVTNPDSAALGLDRLRAGARARHRRADAAEVSRAFVAELQRLCEHYPWVVLCFDTWEQTGRYLGGWLRDLLWEGAFGSVPANVIVVLAGRDELSERDWAPLRSQVADVPLDVFTEAETRDMLARRGVTESTVVETIWHLSMGLPLIVELLALTRPESAGDVTDGGNAVDSAVERFVQWITNPLQRETALACALAPQLNEDVFAAVAPREARHLWAWLCEQPFVTSRGNFKQYHAVVRASMLRQQRARSPQRWNEAHIRLAEIHGSWCAAAERALAPDKRWDDPWWRQSRLGEIYHLLCAEPTVGIAFALEQGVQAAGAVTAVLRQWTDTLQQAANDTAEPVLLVWAQRLQDAVAGEEPAVAALTALLAHGGLDSVTQAWAHTYRGYHLYLADQNEEAITELGRAIATDPGNSRAWAYRGNVHLWLNHFDRAAEDLTTALELAPDDARILGCRGDCHRQAGNYAEAIDDLTAALDIDPALHLARVTRGITHRMAGRDDQAREDLTTVVKIDPTNEWALVNRGVVHQKAGRYEDAVADFTAALEIKPTDALALLNRGKVYQKMGRYKDAVADFTATLGIAPPTP